jgi:hypothetical protein
MDTAIEIVENALRGINSHDLFAQGARAALEDVLAQMKAQADEEKRNPARAGQSTGDR